jgi:hypothetical protein
VYVIVALTLGLIAVVVGVVFANDPQGPSILLAVILGGFAVWAALGLFVTSTPAPAGREWLPWVMRGAIVIGYLALSLALWFQLGPYERADRSAVVTFYIAVLAAVFFDWLQAARKRPTQVTP